jgi:tripeptide aminopeptidase
MELPMINEQRLLDLFLTMCRVNTPPRQEKALVDMVQARLEAMGLSCVRDEAHKQTGGDSGNLIATLPGTMPGATPIFFSAHFDTVEPNPDVPIIVENGVARTDGSAILGADDKGGMAPIIEAMQALIENDIPHGDIQLLLDVSEEIGLLGARHIDRSLVTAKMGFVLDTGPPVGTVVYTAPTHDIFDVIITGRPAHAGFEPEKGVSAIQAAARAIEKMRLGRLDEETTANVGVIQGGAATNVVCPEVKLRAEARSRNPEKLAAQVQHMTEALHEAAADFGAELDVTITRQYDGYRLPEDAPVIRLAQQAAREIGLESKLRAAGGGSDANVFNALGIPSCVLATGMTKIHTHEEQIAVADLARSAEWVIAIAQAAARQDA